MGRNIQLKLLNFDIAKRGADECGISVEVSADLILWIWIFDNFLRGLSNNADK